MIRAAHVGEFGFVRYLHELRGLHVLSQDEVLAWLRLHGAVTRMVEPQLDNGERLNEEAFEELERELGSA